MYDITIIGGGPGGVAAGVYAARKRLKTLFVTDEWGGQSIVSEDIQNWIGTKHIKGEQLAKDLKSHLEEYKGDVLEIVDGQRVGKVEKKDAGFTVTLENGKAYETKTVLITVGSTRRKLTIPGADVFDNKGVTYCASCDGPLYGGMDLVVVGGGNAAFETAAQLLAYAKSVTLIQRGKDFRADPITVEKVLAHPNMKGITNTELVRVEGEKFVKSLVYKDLADGKEKELPAAGIFVEIGLIPSTDFVKELVALDDAGHIIVDPRTQETSVPGVWAAGDCTDGLYHQNNIAVGDAVKALEDIYMHLHTR
jgi:alkyl hydroperoxide reductase subunit F